MRTISVCVLSHFNYIRPCATPWTIAQQAPLSMDFPSKNTGLACHALLQGSPQTRVQTHVSFVSCISGSLYHWDSGKPWKPFFRNMLKSPLKKEVIMWQISWFILSLLIFIPYMDFPGGSDSKASDYNAGDPVSIPRSGRSPGEGNGNPLQYSCLENPMEGGSWSLPT